MALALFDLDNTLLNGDSDHAWGEFLCDKNIVDAKAYKKANDDFFDDYKNGTLDIIAYQEFALTALIKLSPKERNNLHAMFMHEIISPMMQKKASDKIAEHQSQGDTCVVITATNRFITAPIVSAYGIEHLIATEPEIIDGAFTGKILGDPCFQHGKITKLNTWLETHSHALADAWFYSDSANDIPLMQHIDKPIAVDPDERLYAHALKHDWPVISFR